MKNCFRLDAGNAYTVSSRVLPTQYTYLSSPVTLSGSAAFSTSSVVISSEDFLGVRRVARTLDGVHSFVPAGGSVFIPNQQSSAFYDQTNNALVVVGDLFRIPGTTQDTGGLAVYGGLARPVDLSVGRAISYTFSTSAAARTTVTSSTQELTLLAIEPLTTPAGNFENTCKFSLRNTLPTSTTPRLQTIWYAPGLGIVRSVITVEMGTSSSVPVHTMTTIIESFSTRAPISGVVSPVPATTASTLKSCLNVTAGNEFTMQGSFEPTRYVAQNGSVTNNSSVPHPVTVSTLQTAFLGVPQTARRQMTPASAPAGVVAVDNLTSFYVHGPTSWAQIGSQSDSSGDPSRVSHRLVQGSSLNFDLGIGQSHTYTWKVSSFTGGTSASFRTVTSVATFESVEPLQTDAGLLPVTCRIKLTQLHPVVTYPTSLTSWYAPGLGLVQQRQSVDYGALYSPSVHHTIDRLVRIIRRAPEQLQSRH